MLDLQVSGLRQRERIVAAVPPYRAETAAAAAAQCARDWQELSEELGRRASAEARPERSSTPHTGLPCWKAPFMCV
ncbi:hypothetical protein [Streptomyces sp. A0592]|uniref:hypothetical protein n=1 Tax=Streptomyces sp. A0592 TaxID=2563099 RepID=UPI0019D1C065|nr:hypothetical protein [Streptomyces sp. A0592]